MTSYKIYGTENCVWCKRAVEVLEGIEAEYDYISVGVDVTLGEFQQMFQGATTVPQIVSPDGEHMGGYNELLTSLM